MLRNKSNNLIAALDIGTSKVVAVVADILPDGRLEIIGLGSHVSRGMKKGVVINIDAIVQSIRQAIKEAELSAGCEIKLVLTGIAGNHISSFNSEGVVAIRDGEVSQEDIDRVIAAAKAVAIPGEQKILHVLPQSYIIDDQDRVLEPLGMTGMRLEAKIHVVTGAVSVAQNIVNSIRRCRVEVDDMVLEQLASAHAVLQEDERQLGVSLIDIGGGTSDIVSYLSGVIEHTAVIPVAGDHVTNDLAVAFRLATHQAEQLKVQYGHTWVEDADCKDNLVFPCIPEKLSQAKLAAIIEPRYAELFELIKLELEGNDLLHKLSAGIVLTGGSTKMPGVVKLASKIFRCPVRIGVPRFVQGMEKQIFDPTYSTVIGLLQHGHNNFKLQEKETASIGVRGIFKRVKGWLQGNL